MLWPIYARRYRKLMAAITKHLVPFGIMMPPLDKHGVASGYYVWLPFPDNIRASDVALVAVQEHNLLIYPDSLFLVDGDTSDAQRLILNSVRLCFV
jgi:DNA-binding transcriptional MocR family regulator